MVKETPEAVREYMRAQAQRSWEARKKKGEKTEIKRLTEISRAYWKIHKGKPKGE